MHRWVKRIVITTTIVAVLGVGWYVYHRHNYPYGWSHCCDKQLHNSLTYYAEKHGGWFPRGEATPEASLSLMYRDNPEYTPPNLLRGKTIPLEVVRARLEAGELLTPETCGWHYVEGLRQDDNRKLALFWDKIPLGHNGERLTGGRWVHLIGDLDYIPDDKWDEFLTEQARLRAALKRSK